MHRFSVQLPDPVYEALRARAAGGSLSATAATLIERALLVDAGDAITEYEATRVDPEWETRRPAQERA